MRVSATKTAPRIEQNIYSSSNKIKLYGLKNDYPQKIIEIINSSGTGKVCVDLYTKFMRGTGFVDANLNELQINVSGERVFSILNKTAEDFRRFNGFAVLVKYNGMIEMDELFHVPFEHCRIEIDKNKKYTGRIAIHPDWTSQRGISFRRDDIVYITKYNPKTVQAEMALAGSPEKYVGQVFYYTADGCFEYPICPFDAIVTDMLTEESVSTVKYRNAKHNFLPSGILVRKGIKPKTNDDGTIDEDDPAYQQQISSADEIKKMQGDENAAKIWVVDIDSDEEKPDFIPFDGKNYDKQYEYTEKTVQDNIGRMSMIPPILRGVDIGAGFGADLMTNAYDFMNSITSEDRKRLSMAFMDLFILFPQKYASFEIQPLSYITKTNATI
jgi:hypothetical protein